MQQLGLPGLRSEGVGRHGFDKGGERGGGGALEACVDGCFDDEQFQTGETRVFGIGLAVGGVDDCGI